MKKDFQIKMVRVESARLLRLVIIMILVGSFFVFGIKTWFLEYYISTVEKQAICFNQGGSWILWEMECESYRANPDVFEDVCLESGGEYQGCISQCRNQLNAESRVCQAPCINVCKY